MVREKKAVKNPETSEGSAYYPEDVRKVHDEAYKKGFSDGFDKANDMLVEEELENPYDENPNPEDDPE